MKKFILFLALSLMGMRMLAQDSLAYFAPQQIPDAAAFLPAPPDTNSMLFIDDFQQWLWGKSMRVTPRGQRASWESLYGVDRMCEIYSQALGITLSKQATPAIYRLLLRVSVTAEFTVGRAKAKYMRKRPFARMNEHVGGMYDNEDDLRVNGSYPSGHTTLGWSTALALAHVAPEKQDSILRRGWEYGESRVIVGAHWQSDVDAARLAASAGVARMLNNPAYKADLEAARKEYLQKSKALPALGYANSLRVLPPIPDTADLRYQGEVAAYWTAKALRNTPRGEQAIADHDKSTPYLLKMFSEGLNVRLDTNRTPNIASYVKYVAQAMGRENRRVKDTIFRKRPYVQLGEPSLIPQDEEEERTDSSYPSGHSAIGWGVALALVELTGNGMNAVLQRGFDYGYSRLIAGYHWASDVRDARLLAAYTLIRLQHDTEFQRLLAAAIAEYDRMVR